MKMASLSASTSRIPTRRSHTHSLKEYGDIPIGDVHGCYDELIALLHKVELPLGKIPSG